VETEIEPDVPAVVVPVENTKEPLTPDALPEFEVCILMLPVSDALLPWLLPD
jgi:hypothetical protein